MKIECTCDWIVGKENLRLHWFNCRWGKFHEFPLTRKIAQFSLLTAIDLLSVIWDPPNKSAPAVSPKIYANHLWTSRNEFSFHIQPESIFSRFLLLNFDVISWKEGKVKRNNLLDWAKHAEGFYCSMMSRFIGTKSKLLKIKKKT